jgi:hypothetical protein
MGFLGVSEKAPSTGIRLIKFPQFLQRSLRNL